MMLISIRRVFPSPPPLVSIERCDDQKEPLPISIYPGVWGRVHCSKKIRVGSSLFGFSCESLVFFKSKRAIRSFSSVNRFFRSFVKSNESDFLFYKEQGNEEWFSLFLGIKRGKVWWKERIWSESLFYKKQISPVILYLKKTFSPIALHLTVKDDIRSRRSF